jgi:GntR family transcriptional repressor for pyruvate dehydrogenase complex
MTRKNDGIVPVKQLRLSDAVAAQLETLVRSGHFGSDGKFPSERDLAEQFGVGRSTMREAISKLETMGIISRSHGVGTFALEVSEISHRGISLLSAGEVTALELFEIRYALEPTSAAMSAERRTTKDIQELKAVLKRATQKEITSDEFVKLDFEFHNLIAGSSKNRLLVHLYSQLAPHHAIYSANVISFANRRESAHQGHSKILEAIIDQDPKAAEKEAYSHLRLAEKDLMKEITKLNISKK